MPIKLADSKDLVANKELPEIGSSYERQKTESTLDESNLSTSEAVIQRCSVKKVFLEISENSQENTWARVSGTSVFL